MELNIEGADSIAPDPMLLDPTPVGPDSSAMPGSRDYHKGHKTGAPVQLDLFAANPYSLKLDFFSGPMDLLLHLVSQNELPIEEVCLAQVADQYLAIVEKNASFLDLEKASEYLVIAAELLAYKSAFLLPKEAAELSLEGFEDFDRRFFDDLVSRLKAYELTKNRALALISHPQLGVDVFSRQDRKALLPTPEMLAEPEDPHTLGQLFGRLLRRIGGIGSSIRINIEPISVVSLMMKAVDYFAAARKSANGKSPGENELPEGEQTSRRSFMHFVCSVFGRAKEENSTACLSPRGLLVGGFMAVLELVKRGLLEVSQETGKDIEVSLRFAPTSESLRESFFSSEPELSAESLLVEEAALLEPGAEGEFQAKEAVGSSKVVHIEDFRSVVGVGREDSLRPAAKLSGAGLPGAGLVGEESSLLEGEEMGEVLKEVQNV